MKRLCMRSIRSKLANVLFARRLQQLESTITTCSCHVGCVDTNIWAAGGPFVQSIIDHYTKTTMRTIEEGTRTMLKCALSKSPSIVRGAAYLDGMGVVVDEKSLHPPSKNDTLAKDFGMYLKELPVVAKAFNNIVK